LRSILLHLLEVVIRKKKKKPSREGKATVGATGPALQQKKTKDCPDLLRSIYWNSKLFESINLSDKSHRYH
jgi:hypothetical protein